MSVKKFPEYDINQPIVILVEGENDRRFLSAFLKHLGYERIQIISVGSKDNFSKGLKAVLGQINKIKCLGITRDAEENPESSFQSICSILKNNKLPIPSKPLELEGNNPSVSVLIIPPDKPGSLETLCLESISSDVSLKCVDEYIKCLELEGLGINKFTKAKLDKLKLQSFLASRRPEIRLGEAAEASFFPFDAESFEVLKFFIKSMYEKCVV